MTLQAPPAGSRDLRGGPVHYSLVSSPVLGFDLVRVAGGSEVAGVLLLGLSCGPAELAVLSGRTETVDLLDRIRVRVGDDPKDWLEPFHRERRMIP